MNKKGSTFINFASENENVSEKVKKLFSFPLESHDRHELQQHQS